MPSKDGMQVQSSFLQEPAFEDLDGQHLFLPYSRTRRWIAEDDPMLAVQRAFPLGRLDGIKQLSFLSYSGPDPAFVSVLEQYPHTRRLHSLQVGLVSREIVRRNGGSQEQQNLALVAGHIHDIATPAHGDATKLVDPENLDEEDHWQEIIGNREQAFLRQQGIGTQQLDDIIHNKGVLGRVLDIADRIAYTMQDTFEIAGDIKGPNAFEVHPYTAVIRAILQKNPLVGDIYKDVGIDWQKGQVVFANLPRLEVFLYLRAHLFQQHYMFPRNLGRDMVVAHLIKPFYSPDKEDAGKDTLTPQKLREMDDYKLRVFLSTKYGYDIDSLFYTHLLDWHPQFKRYETQQDAARGLSELQDNPDIVYLGRREVTGFNTGANYLVKIGNHAETFEEASGRALLLKRINAQTRGTFDFYVPDDGSDVARMYRQANQYSEERQKK